MKNPFYFMNVMYVWCFLLLNFLLVACCLLIFIFLNFQKNLFHFEYFIIVEKKNRESISWNPFFFEKFLLKKNYHWGFFIFEKVWKIFLHVSVNNFAEIDVRISRNNKFLHKILFLKQRLFFLRAMNSRVQKEMFYQAQEK